MKSKQVSHVIGNLCKADYVSFSAKMFVCHVLLQKKTWNVLIT